VEKYLDIRYNTPLTFTTIVNGVKVMPGEFTNTVSLFCLTAIF
jgi:hypothetical protein